MTRARVKSFHIIIQIIFFVLLMSEVQCQRQRSFSRRRHRPHQMPFQPIFIPSAPVWHHHQFNDREYPGENSNFNNQIGQIEERSLESDCPYIFIKKIASDGLYGMISIKNQIKSENVTIEIEFDEFISAFVVKKNLKYFCENLSLGNVIFP